MKVESRVHKYKIEIEFFFFIFMTTGCQILVYAAYSMHFIFYMLIYYNKGSKNQLCHTLVIITKLCHNTNTPNSVTLLCSRPGTK